MNPLPGDLCPLTSGSKGSLLPVAKISAPHDANFASGARTVSAKLGEPPVFPLLEKNDEPEIVACELIAPGTCLPIDKPKVTIAIDTSRFTAGLTDAMDAILAG